MKKGAAALALMLSGCGAAEWARAPDAGGPACAASCDAHYDQCPKVFANFPERGAVECPAERAQCLKACGSPEAPAHTAGTPPAPPPAPAPSVPATAVSARSVEAKEAKLRELKHFHDEGLITEDVYRERQTAILREP